MTNNFARLTILGVGLLIASVLTSATIAQASVPSKISYNRKINQAQWVVNQTLEKLSADRDSDSEVVTASRRRTPADCLDKSSCVSKAFADDLRHYRFKTKTIFLSASPKQGDAIQMPIQIMVDGERQSLSVKHSATIVWLIGGWRVVDPLVLQSAALEPLKHWEKRLVNPESISISIR
jgi:hypothetical protein